MFCLSTSVCEIFSHSDIYNAKILLLMNFLIGNKAEKTKALFRCLITTIY